MKSSSTNQTYDRGSFKLRRGKPHPFGARVEPWGVNFSIFVGDATACTLVLFEKGKSEAIAEIPFPEAFRTGKTYSMGVLDLDGEKIEYGYRLDGPYDFAAGRRYDPTVVLLDPYAKQISGREVWGWEPHPGAPYAPRCSIATDDFDWEGDRPPAIPLEDTIVYEMHARGFTADPSSGVAGDRRGTYAGIIDKIPYFKDLGVNCIELMPIFEFNELENVRVCPATGDRLYNYWGYSTVAFFAPKAGYAAGGRSGGQIDELKSLIKALHQNGIEVLLDVVFNHTAENTPERQGDAPTLSFRGIANGTYYILDPAGRYQNYSGCGNSMNGNHPVTRAFIADCLRYWVAEFHVDGFRFDPGLGFLSRSPRKPPRRSAAGCRDRQRSYSGGRQIDCRSLGCCRPVPSGFLSPPRPLDRMERQVSRYDPQICEKRAGYGSGAEPAADGLARSLRRSRPSPAASVNFITAHDGFTLADLVGYNDKHNEANGLNNNDGANDNNSWNCGCEGPADDPGVLALRQRQMRNAVLLLFVSQGVPMMLMGDEMGRTKDGNNNTYCRDGRPNWLDWQLLEKNADSVPIFSILHCFSQAASGLAAAIALPPSRSHWQRLRRH